jgi:hypothetical protein
MSPIKRAITKDFTDEAWCVRPKRLRGGGVDGGAFYEHMIDDDQLFDDDDNNVGIEEEIPAEILAQQAQVVSTVAAKDQQRWKRARLPDDLSNQTDLNLQWLDMDVVSGKPLPANPNRTKPLVGRREGQVPILRGFGVDERGHSIAVFVHGFTPCTFPNSERTDGVSIRRTRHPSTLTHNHFYYCWQTPTLLWKMATN